MLHKIPLEIWDSILYYVSPNDLLQLSSTNHLFHDITSSNFIWKRICSREQLSITCPVNPKKRYLEYTYYKRLLLESRISKEERQLHQLGVSFIKTLPNSLILSAGWDGQVIVSNTHGKICKDIKLPGPIQSMSFQPDSNMILIGTRGSRSLSMIHYSSFCLFTIPLAEPVVASDHTKEYILVAGPSNVYLYSTKTRLLLETILLREVTHIHVYNGCFIAVTGSGQISLWCLPIREKACIELSKLETEPGLSSCSLTPMDDTTSLLLCGYKNGTIRQITCQNQTLQQSSFFQSDADWICSVLFLAAPELIQAGSWDNRIRIFDRQGRLLKHIPTTSAPTSLLENLEKHSFACGNYNGSTSTFKLDAPF